MKQRIRKSSYVVTKSLKGSFYYNIYCVCDDKKTAEDICNPKNVDARYYKYEAVKVPYISNNQQTNTLKQ